MFNYVCLPCHVFQTRLAVCEEEPAEGQKGHINERVHCWSLWSRNALALDSVTGHCAASAVRT